jgi:hypothetical protein
MTHLLRSSSQLVNPMNRQRFMGFGTGAGGSGETPNSTEAQAWFNRLMPYPTASRELILGTFVDSLVAAGLGEAFDVLYVNCLENVSNALTDVWRTDRQGRIFQATSGLTFTANRGFSGGVSGNYVDTRFNPSTAVGARYTLNNASIFYWGHSADGAASINQYAVFAATDAAPQTLLSQLGWAPSWSNLAYININCVTQSSATNSVGYNRFNLVQRTAASGAGSTIYYGDTNTAIVSSSQASTALPNGTIRFRMSHPTSIMGIGRSLNSAERVALRAACIALVTSLTGGLP